MSRENVEVVRASIDAFQQGEFETALSYYSEDVVFYPLVAGPYRGRAGVAEQMGVWMEEFNDYWFEGEELIDAGDKVVLFWRQGGEGKASGIRIQGEGSTVFRVEDGRICHARVYLDRAEALEAAGLKEWAMSQENVEIMRRMLDQAQEKPDALYDILDQDVQWDATALGVPGLTTFHGPDGVREFFRRWVGAFEEWGYDTEELIDAGDSVVVRIHQWGRGKGSGVAVEGRFWQVWTFRDGKVIRSSHHVEKARALQVAGLSE
jgi:ketosteroid isomerase-like protein